MGWSPGLTHRLGRVILAWAQKVPEARRAGSEWALDGSTTGRFQTQAFSSSALPSFPLTFSSFLSPFPASCVFLPTSLQLLVCILLHDAEQMLIEDAVLTVGSAWLWASCLDIDKGNRVSLLLLDHWELTKSSCCPEHFFLGLERTGRRSGQASCTWETPGSPRIFPFSLQESASSKTPPISTHGSVELDVHSEWCAFDFLHRI